MTIRAMRSTSFRRLVILLAVVVLVAGCSRGNVTGHHDVLLENRSDKLAVTTSIFFNQSVVPGIGGNLMPGQLQHRWDYDYEVTDRARLRFGVYPPDVDLKDFAHVEQHRIGPIHDLECPIPDRSRLHDTDTLWFIIDPDFTLRLVVMPRAEFLAMKRDGKRPR